MLAVDWYTTRKNQVQGELQALHRAYRRLHLPRLIVALTLVGFAIGAGFHWLGSWAWTASALLIAVFGGMAVAHHRIAKSQERTTWTLQYQERTLKRLAGDWHGFQSTGEKYLSNDHPYALDLDVFGAASLFQLVNDTQTSLGEATLAESLLNRAEPEEIQARQEAVKELAELHSFRERLWVAGARLETEKPNPEALLVWATSPSRLNLSLAVQVYAWLGPIAVIACLIAGSYQLIPSWCFLVPALANAFLASSMREKLEPAINAVSAGSDQLQAYTEMLQEIERQSFASERLVALHKTLHPHEKAASAHLASLARIVSVLDARRNGAFRFLVVPTLLWDLHCVAALERWQRQAGQFTRAWVRAIAELEVLSSLASLAYANPDYCYPNVQPDQPIEAEELGHPLLANEKRVSNSVTLSHAGSMLLVTGSNMSGKSTLLRSLGLSIVLAQCGGPVCARQLKLPVCQLRTSMRISDSLKDGISRFYAELLKIKAVTDATQSPPPVVYLLDEILHGTNSRERHLGARSIIELLMSRGAMGAVSTHDLALADLANEHPNNVKLVHFQEHVVDGEMVFDYKLREGVVSSGNALRWMRHIGLPVDDSQVS